MVSKIFVALCLVLLACAAPVEDEVKMDVPYTGHKWYSGNFPIYIRISQLHPWSLPLCLFRFTA